MFIKNEIVLDGKVQKNVKVFDEIINFNLSANTGIYIDSNNEQKNRYTFIRVLYVGEINDKVKNIIKQGNFIRVYGKLDSEQYKSQSGKIVYNKILCVNKITKLEYDQDLDMFIEVV